jgi:hypothetical protein
VHHLVTQAPASINPLKTLDSDASDDEEEPANGNGNGKAKKQKKQVVSAL